MKTLFTRMHSSRMRTGRSLTVCCSLLPGGGVVVVVSAPGGCLARGDVPGPGGQCLLQGGCAWSQGGGGVCSGGVCLVPGGVSAPGGVCLVPGGVVSAPVGVAWSRGDAWSRGVSQHALRQTPSPPVDRILDTRL